MIHEIKVGQVLYQLTLVDGDFFIREHVFHDRGDDWGTRLYVSKRAMIEAELPKIKAIAKEQLEHQKKKLSVIQADILKQEELLEKVDGLERVYNALDEEFKND